MKKIALFLPDLEGGGAQRIVLTLAENFVANGIAVDLILIKAEGPFLKDVPRRVKLISLLSTTNSRSLIGVVVVLYKLVKYLRLECPDCLVSSMSRPNILASISRYLAKTLTPLILREDNTSPNIRDWPTRLGMRWFYPRANGCIAISEGVKQDLMHFFSVQPQNIFTVHNPVDVYQVRHLANENIPHPWFRSNTVPVILGIGRLTAQKDFSTLIRAFAAARSNRALKLIILGEGPLRFKLENLVCELKIKNDVWMPGFVSNPYAYMKGATLFVLSSKWEGLGVVVIEALALGMRVVSTDCHSGPAEILDNGHYGRLVPVGDVDALNKAILLSLDDAVDEALLRKRADMFSPEKIIPQYLSILSSIATH